jgi:hypothetical protein
MGIARIRARDNLEAWERGGNEAGTPAVWVWRGIGGRDCGWVWEPSRRVGPESREHDHPDRISRRLELRDDHDHEHDRGLGKPRLR